MKNNNSFLIFLNITLGILLLGSILFAYVLGNFGGISLQELKKNYVQKSELNFSDLPKKIQKNYINKQSVQRQTEVVINDDRAFDEDGNPIEIIKGSNDDLQSIISSLQSKILFLEKENMLISSEKEELLNRIDNLKNKSQNEQHSIVSTNLEKLNEVERQHYQNISDLTMKINDLQRENIRLTQAISKQEEEKEEQASSIDKQLAIAKEKIQNNFQEQIETKDAKIALLKQEKQTIQKRLNSIENRIAELDQVQKRKLEEKEEHISKLQQKINNLIKEKNTILTKNSNTMLELEKKNSQKQSEFNKIIMSHKAEKDALKTSYNSSIEKIKNSYEGKIKALEQDVDSLSKKLIASKKEKIKELQQIQRNFEKEKNNLLTKKESSLETVKNKNVTLEKALSNLEKMNNNLKEEIKTFKNEIQEAKDQQLQLLDKIANLEEIKSKTSTKLKEELKNKEEKHNENYRIFNEKIALLEGKLEQLQKEEQEREKRADEELQIALATLQKEENKRDMLSKKLANAQEKISKLESDNESLTLSENEKLLEIRASFKELQASVEKREKTYENAIAQLRDDLVLKDRQLANYEKDKERLGDYTREITKLKKTLNTIEGQIVTSDTVPISDKKRKLAQLGKVECDDMNFGNFKISSTCKQKVNAFLNKYNQSHYFEVIPIVDTGGFSTLKRIKTESNLDIPQSEIDRLTNLANLGLGKHRAKEAGWLIREKYGDYAKISYTVYNIEAEDKRGFVIRAYR